MPVRVLPVTHEPGVDGIEDLDELRKRSWDLGSESDVTAPARPSHELDAPPWLRVESTLMATARAIRFAYNARLADLGLTLTQASVLVFLNDSGPLRQAQLAEKLGVGRAAMGTTIDWLERHAFVERQIDPTDGRAWRVLTTPKGKDLVEPITQIDLDLRTDLRRGISREDRQVLAKLLLQMQWNLARIASAPPRDR